MLHLNLEDASVSILLDYATQIIEKNSLISIEEEFEGDSVERGRRFSKILKEQSNKEVKEKDESVNTFQQICAANRKINSYSKKEKAVDTSPRIVSLERKKHLKSSDRMRRENTRFDNFQHMKLMENTPLMKNLQNVQICKTAENLRKSALNESKVPQKCNISLGSSQMAASKHYKTPQQCANYINETIGNIKKSILNFELSMKQTYNSKKSNCNKNASNIPSIKEKIKLFNNLAEHTSGDAALQEKNSITTRQPLKEMCDISNNYSSEIIHETSRTSKINSYKCPTYPRIIRANKENNSSESSVSTLPHKLGSADRSTSSYRQKAFYEVEFLEVAESSKGIIPVKMRITKFSTFKDAKSYQNKEYATENYKKGTSVKALVAAFEEKTKLTCHSKLIVKEN